MLRSISLAFAAAMAFTFVSQSSAQMVVQAGGTGGARYTYSQTGQSLLYYPQLQKEIEIVDDQKAELQKIQTDMQAKMTEAYKTMNDQQAGGQKSHPPASC